MDPVSEQTELFEWDALHGLSILPMLGAWSDVIDINDEGQIVGLGSPTSPSEDATGVAALWDDGAVYDLNDLISTDSGWILTEADSINNLGQIVGIGTYEGQMEGFLLTPIPEPEADLLAMGLCSIALCKRRKRS